MHLYVSIYLPNGEVFSIGDLPTKLKSQDFLGIHEEWKEGPSDQTMKAVPLQTYIAFGIVNN